MQSNGFKMSFSNEDYREQLVAVLCNINNNRFFPSKQEVANCRTDYNTQAKPNIVRHKD